MVFGAVGRKTHKGIGARERNSMKLIVDTRLEHTVIDLKKGDVLELFNKNKNRTIKPAAVLITYSGRTMRIRFNPYTEK